MNFKPTWVKIVVCACILAIIWISNYFDSIILAVDPNGWMSSFAFQIPIIYALIIVLVFYIIQSILDKKDYGGLN